MTKRFRIYRNEEEDRVVDVTHFGNDVADEFLHLLPMALAVSALLMGLAARCIVMIRNKLLTAEELEEIRLEDERRKPSRIEQAIRGMGGRLGTSFADCIASNNEGNRALFQIARALVRRGIRKWKARSAAKAA